MSGWKHRAVAVAVAWAALGVAAVAAPVDALQQPAQAVREPQRAVYLAGAHAGQRLVVVGERGLIAVSDDGGAAWRQVPVPVSASLTAVQFVSPKVGWAIGHYGVVLGTQDGGETWTRLLDGRGAAAEVLRAAQAAGEADPAAQRRLAAARRLVEDGPDKPLLDLCFLDERVGYVVGAYNLMLRTEDGGRHWQAIGDRLDNPRDLHLYAIAASGSTLYVAGEQGLLLRSDDAGGHFERLALPYAGSLFTLQPMGADGVVVAGLRGNAFASDDRGRHWRGLAGGPPVSYIASYPAGTVGVQLLNQAGQRFLVRGERLEPVAAVPLPPVSGALPLSSNQWLMLTQQGLVRLTDSGPRP